jgi:uncharacterized protein (TIGR00369 family)
MTDENNIVLSMIQSTVGQPPTEFNPPFNQWLGGVLKRIDINNIVVEHTIRHNMTNSAGLIHGGVVSSIFDDVLGTLANAQGKDTIMVTVNLYVDFLGPAKKDDTITTTGTIVKSGNRLVNVEGVMTRSDGELIASAKVNFIASNIKIPF